MITISVLNLILLVVLATVLVVASYLHGKSVQKRRFEGSFPDLFAVAIKNSDKSFLLDFLRDTEGGIKGTMHKLILEDLLLKEDSLGKIITAAFRDGKVSKDSGIAQDILERFVRESSAKELMYPNYVEVILVGLVDMHPLRIFVDKVTREARDFANEGLSADKVRNENYAECLYLILEHKNLNYQEAAELLFFYFWQYLDDKKREMVVSRLPKESLSRIKKDLKLTSIEEVKGTEAIA